MAIRHYRFLANIYPQKIANITEDRKSWAVNFTQREGLHVYDDNQRQNISKDEKNMVLTVVRILQSYMTCSTRPLRKEKERLRDLIIFHVNGVRNFCAAKTKQSQSSLTPDENLSHK